MTKENTQSGTSDAQAGTPDEVRGRSAVRKPHARKSVRSQGGSRVMAKQAPASGDDAKATEPSAQSEQAPSQPLEPLPQPDKSAAVDLSKSLPSIELPDSEADEEQEGPLAEAGAPASDGEEPPEEGEDEAVSDGEEGKSAEGEEALGDGKKRKRFSVKPGSIRIVVFALFAFLILAAVAWASFFAWDRWGRYDDHADIQGEWYVDGTAALVTIDENAIHLDEHVAYAYELNEHDKTIKFSFGSWEGQGRYRFSDDRRRLLVIDGEFTSMGNLLDDLAQPFDEMAVVGSRSALASGEGAVSGSGSAEAVPAASGESASSASPQASSSASASAGASSSGGGKSEGTEVGLSLFSRDPDPAAVEAKEAAEKAAKEKAEEEAKKAKAEEDEEEEYEYYDTTDEVEYTSDSTEEEQSSEEEGEWDEEGSEEDGV